MLEYLSVACIFMVAGFAQGVTGFGSALVAMPLLLLFLDAKVAVPLCILNGLLITAYLSWQLRRHMDWRKILPLGLGCLPGIYVGVSFLRAADSDLIKLALGGLLTAYGLHGLLFRPVKRRVHPAWGYVAGFGTGAIGAAFSAGGPPAIIYTTMSGWSKDSIKATLSGFFLANGICIALAHAVNGLTTMVVFHYFAAAALAVLAGVWAGSRFYGRISTEAYIRVILFLLVCMGGMMIVTTL